jgi:hypothetical protein
VVSDVKETLHKPIQYDFIGCIISSVTIPQISDSLHNLVFA